mmetsp:Transcript_15269/g.38761  ORF Transcript_15269/g.38761 Transcript_15269/m.38761 type:complete len:261 (-) Transcript_15269:320-1102(-)
MAAGLGRGRRGFGGVRLRGGGGAGEEAAGPEPDEEEEGGEGAPLQAQAHSGHLRLGPQAPFLGQERYVDQDVEPVHAVHQGHHGRDGREEEGHLPGEAAAELRRLCDQQVRGAAAAPEESGGADEGAAQGGGEEGQLQGGARPGGRGREERAGVHHRVRVGLHQGNFVRNQVSKDGDEIHQEAQKLFGVVATKPASRHEGAGGQVEAAVRGQVGGEEGCHAVAVRGRHEEGGVGRAALVAVWQRQVRHDDWPQLGRAGFQ